MVIAFGKLTVLPVKTVSAEVVLARGTAAVATPVAYGTHDNVELGVVGIGGPTLPHRHVMRGVEGRGADVADGPRETGRADNRVARAEGVAVVLDEPEPMLVAEGLDGGEVEGIAQGVRHHDGLGPAGVEGSLKTRDVYVVLGDGDINEDRHGTKLDDGRDGGGKARGNGDDLVATTDGPLAELGCRQGREREEVRRGPRVDHAGEAHAKVAREGALELGGPRSCCEPEVKRRVNEVDHLTVIVDARRVADPVPRGEGLALVVVAVTVLAHEGEDLLPRLCLALTLKRHYISSSR